jgi:hypothetical protein
MDLSSKLAHLQTVILDQVTRAANSRDLTDVAQWSEAAKECDQLIRETHTLETRTGAFEKSVQRRLENPARFNRVTQLQEEDSVMGSLSAKAEGARVRADWLQKVHSAGGIELVGHGTRYRTAKQLNVGIAFANENAQRPNKWFLGLPGEPTDIVVLLCRALDQSMHDLVLPIAELGDIWKRFARSKGQVKLHVQQEEDELYLLVPRSEPLIVTKYEANYRSLR